MEQNLEENTPVEETAKAPVRRRASRRATAAAGVAAEVTVTTTEAPAAAEAPAATEAPASAAPAAAEAPAEAPKRATRSRKKAEPVADATVIEAPATETSAAEAQTAEAQTAEAQTADAPAVEAPKKRVTRSRKKVEPAAEAAADANTDANADAPADAGSEAPQSAPKADDENSDAGAAAKGTRTRASRSKGAQAKGAQTKGAQTNDTQSQDAGSNEAAPSGAAAGAEDATPAEEQENTNGRRSRRRSNSGDKSDRNDRNDKNDQSDKSDQSDDQNSSQNDEGKSRGRGGRQQDNSKSDGDKQENGSRSSRTRQRDRKRRGGDDHEVEISEDDVLLPIAGILDVLDNYAFVRTSGYLPGVSDVYVALGQVKKYGLRRGDAVVGAIRQPRDSDGGGRQKYNAIVKIDSVNGKAVEETEKRPDIAEMTPVYPQKRLRLGSTTDRVLGRAIDAVAPVGLGQRGLIVLPSQFSGAEVVRELATDIATSAPEAHLMVVLTDAQPEVATELSRSTSGEVVAATFDRLPEDQTTISELGIDRARRLVELGHDVIVLVDSLDRLARGYAQSQQPSARPALGTIDEYAIFQVKRLLAAARNVENGGSLTLLATVNAASANESEALLLREARAVANSVIEFDENSSLEAPVLDARVSRTQNLQAMLDAKEIAVVSANRAQASAASKK